MIRGSSACHLLIYINRKSVNFPWLFVTYTNAVFKLCLKIAATRSIPLWDNQNWKKKINFRFVLFSLLVYLILDIGDPGIGIILSQVLGFDFSEINIRVVRKLQFLNNFLIKTAFL